MTGFSPPSEPQFRVKEVINMTNASTKPEVKSRKLLKSCVLGCIAAAGLGLMILPAYADAVSSSRSSNSASAEGNNSSVRQTTRQTNIQRSDGTADSISIQDARNNGSVSGDNNHVDQNIDQYNDSQASGGEDSISHQKAETNAHSRGTNNRSLQDIQQNILRR